MGQPEREDKRVSIGCRAKTSSLDRQGSEQKVLWKWLVEIVADVGYDYLGAMLPLKLLDRLNRRPLRVWCGSRSKAGRPLLVTTNVSPPFTSRASSVRHFFASRIDTVLSRKCSYK
jgi:hypothetical protein